MMNVKMTKNELMNVLTNENIKFDKKMTKIQLIELYENHKQFKKFEIVSTNQTIATIEKIENESQNNENVNENFDENMTNEYIDFLNENELNYQFENNQFCVFANKKHIFVKIDNDTNFANVFTILNKKYSNDINEIKLNARNILTLKSIRALKSYTNAQSK